MSKNQNAHISEKFGIIEYSFILAVGLFLLYCIYTMFSLFNSF
jgi:hypothetical protein